MTNYSPPHVCQNRYGDFLLTEAVRPGPGVPVPPREGYRLSRFRDAETGGNYGASDFWCAAGWYAWRVLHVANNVRIYRLSEPPRRGGQPIVFSLDPTGKASRTGLAVIGPDDGSLSVASARALCFTPQVVLDDW